jgi:hypothetical protein
MSERSRIRAALGNRSTQNIDPVGRAAQAAASQ